MNISKLAMGCFLLVATASQARAADSEYRKSVQAKKANGSVVGKRLGLYGRQGAGGRDAVLTAALEAFSNSAGAVRTDGTFRRETFGGDAAVARSDSWTLEVRGDGDWIRYFRSGEFGPGSQTKPSLAELEGPARNFITSSLGRFLNLGANEELQAWKSAHAIRGGGDLQGNRVEEVMASTIIFTRVLGGVPVVGPGSKVAVTLNGGNVVGFHLDWAPVSPLPESVDIASSSVVASRIAAAKGTGSKTEHSIECGLYDAGAMSADKAAPLQPGCVARFISKSPQNLEAGLEHAVPVGTKVHRDRGWPETDALAK